MGSKVYDFLTESFLFDESLIAEGFASVSEDEIREELRRYREYWLSNTSEIEKEVRVDDARVNLFSGLGRADLKLLKQTALYVGQQIVTDPLFDLGRERNPDADTLSAVFGLQTPPFDRTEVQKAVRYLKALTPMVVGDYVKFYPTSRFFEPLREIPFTVSRAAFVERVPAQLHEFFHAHAQVMSARAEGDSIACGWPLELGRGIAVRFKNHPQSANAFFLGEQKAESVDRENRTADITLSAPDSLPSQEVFDAWVTQSINQSAGWMYEQLCTELAVADSFGASYVSNSEFIFQLIEQIAPADSESGVASVNALMNVELPILDQIDTVTLMKVRQEEGEAFAEFRAEWERQINILRSIADPEELKKRTQGVVRELTEVQVAKVNSAVVNLRKHAALSLTIATGSLIGTIQGGGFSLLGLAMAALQGYASWDQYRNAKRQNPAYFLWKAFKG